MKPKLTTLIVAWNAWNDLARCLDSLAAAKLPECETIVIDNGSSDGTADNVRRRFPHVQLYVNAENLGLPPAVNQGFKLAKGEYVLLLDADTEVKPDAVDMLVQFMDGHRDVAVVAPRIQSPQGNLEESARNLPSMMSGLFGRQSSLTRLFPNNPFSARYLGRDNLNLDEPFRVEQVSASCMFIRSSALTSAGPWDEAYRCYWVDTDWCVRLDKLGMPIYCVPQARVIHYENNRAGVRKSPWRIIQFHQGALRLYRKRTPLGALDPRTWFACVALSARAIALLALNTTKPTR